MPVPFIIFSLPRSQTFWLAHYLAPGLRRCGHDIAIGCRTKADFELALRAGLGGTIETGAIVGWRDVKEAMPAVKLLVLRRDVGQVIASLDHAGYPVDVEELARRSLELDLLSEQPGVVTLEWEALRAEGTMAWLYEYCLGLGYDREWWLRLVNVNLQVNRDLRLGRLEEAGPRLMELKASLRTDPVPGEWPAAEITVAVEPWDSVWPECSALAARHWDEVETGVEGHRQYEIDDGMMRQMSLAGALLIVSARRARKLVGYFSWTINRDPEAKGNIVADQGAWFVEPGLGTASPAERMWNRSLAELRLRGVSHAWPHHRLQGRGEHLGRFFERRGAKKVKEVYSIDLTQGDK